MTKLAQKIFLLSIIVFGTGYLVISPEKIDSDNKVKLSDSDSWSRIVMEGGRWFNFELNNNSIYIIGYSGQVSKYNLSGALLWKYTYNFYSVSFPSYVFDSNGNLLILFENPSQGELSLIKLSSSGVLIISKKIYLEDYNHATSITLSDNNSIIIVGYSYSPEKILILKLSSNGNLLWNTTLFDSLLYEYPNIIADSKNNLYIPFYNNGLKLAKINGSGEVRWQIGLQDTVFCANLMIDVNDTLFVIGIEDNTNIFKINGSGFILKELIIDGFHTDWFNSWLFDDILLVASSDLSVIYCYDLNFNHKWDFNLTNYVTPPFDRRIYSARDSHYNIFFLQTNNVGDISLLKINSTGDFFSQILWGGPNNDFVSMMAIDSENNVFFICRCEYHDIWSIRQEYYVLVKNPLDGGTPPTPERDFNENDYFLFGIIGISCVISSITLLSILRSKRERSMLKNYREKSYETNKK